MDTLRTGSTNGLPPPDAIRDKIAEVLARPDYHVEPVAAEESYEWLKLLFRIIEWILTPFRWLMELTEGLPALLRWTIVVGLVVILVLVIAHIVYTIVMAVRGPRRNPSLPALDERATQDPDLLERQAEEAAACGEWVDAIRLLFRAALLRLEAREKRRFRVGTTNREHLRRYRNSPIANPLRLLVDTLDLKWYGDAPCQPDDYATCHQAHAQIRQFATRTADVHAS